MGAVSASSINDNLQVYTHIPVGEGQCPSRMLPITELSFLLRFFIPLRQKASGPGNPAPTEMAVII